VPLVRDEAAGERHHNRLRLPWPTAATPPAAAAARGASATASAAGQLQLCLYPHRFSVPGGGAVRARDRRGQRELRGRVRRALPRGADVLRCSLER
jgi:hypothetical protein